MLWFLMFPDVEENNPTSHLNEEPVWMMRIKKPSSVRLGRCAYRSRFYYFIKLIANYSSLM